MAKGQATRCDEIGHFAAILGQCSQSATHDGMFSYSPAMFIAEMVIRNI